MEHWSMGLFDKPIERVIEGYDDPTLSYEFDVTDIVQVGGEWYIVNTAGCSCPSYEEMASVSFGPGSVEDLREFVEREYKNEGVAPYYAKDGFVEAIEKALDAASAALGSITQRSE